MAADEIERSDDSSVEDLEAPSRKRKAPQTALKVRAPRCLHHWGHSQVHRRHLVPHLCLSCDRDTLQGCASHPESLRLPEHAVFLCAAEAGKARCAGTEDASSADGLGCRLSRGRHADRL